MLKKLVFLIALLCISVFFVALTGLLMGLTNTPDIPMSKSPGENAYKRVGTLTENVREAFNQDQLNKITILPSDISDLSFYTSNRLRVAGKKMISAIGVRSELQNKKLKIAVSFQAFLHYQLYFNASIALSEHDQSPQLDALYLGKFKISGFFIKRFYGVAVKLFLQRDTSELLQMLFGSIKQFSITPDQIVLVYRTDKELKAQLKSGAQGLILGSPEEKDVLQLYLAVIAAAAEQQYGTQVQLSKLLRVLAGFARSRSENEGSAIKENERMLRALAIQVADPATRALLAPGISPPPLSRPLVLRNRTDLTQHFLISAALALVLDESSALEIGVNKEKTDSKHGGSGFSFSDLLADLAGIRFAVAATASEEKAKSFQEFLLKHSGEQAFMPEVYWLPQGLSNTAYNDLIRHPAYPSLLKQMFKRLNGMSIYQ